MTMKLSLRGIIELSPLAMTGLWTLTVLLVWHYQWLGIGEAELRSYNLRFHRRGPLPPDPRVVLVAIDDRSILGETTDEDEIRENPGYECLKDFPYRRRAYALATEKLVKAGARAVVFDLIFLGTSSSGKSDDDALTQALIKYRDKVVIGANLPAVETSKTATTTSIMMPNSDLLPSEIVPDSEIVGFVNYTPDGDGFIRRMDAVGWPLLPKAAEKTVPYSLAALAVKKAFPDSKLPERGEVRFIQFAGPKATYVPIPFYLLFNTKAWEPDRPPLLGGRVFAGKIVLIGPRANFMHDEHLTPFGDGTPDMMPGPDVQVNAIATLLSERILREVSPVQGLWIIAFAGAVCALLLPVARHPFLKLIPACALVYYYWWLAQWCFEGLDLFIPLVPVEALIIGSTASVVAIQAVAEQLEKHRVSGILRRYVSKNVADELIKSGQDVGALLAPQKRGVTVLFSDVRDFTTMTENSDPAQFFQQLNEYLGAMVGCVFNNQGTLDKFVGDAVMAVFGNPTSHGKVEDAWCGVKTAIEMRQRLAELNRGWEKAGKPIFRIGIGLNHGDVMAGDIGSSEKKEYGVIGDAVNVAARVESLTKEQKADILITDSVYELVKDRVEVEQRGDIKVKGRGKPVNIYALRSLKPGTSR